MALDLSTKDIHRLRVQLNSTLSPSQYLTASANLCKIKAARFDEKPGHYLLLEVDGVELHSGTAMATLLTMGIS